MLEKLIAKIKHVLAERKMSLSAFEKEAGIETGTLRYILTGALKEPSIKVIMSLADTLKCPIDELMGREPPFDTKDTPLPKPPLPSPTACLVENIKKILLRDSLSIASLERKAGLNQNTLSVILQGKTKSPTIETVYALANALECSLDELLGRTPSPETINLSSLKNLPWSALMFSQSTERVLFLLDKEKFYPPVKEIVRFVAETYANTLTQNKLDTFFTEDLIRESKEKYGANAS